MRNAKRVGRTVTVRFRYDDFGRATRARSMAHPTSATEPIADVAISIVRSEIDTIDTRGLTLLGLSVGNLMSIDGAAAIPEQLLLPFGRKDRSALDDTLDSLKDRFGRTALTRASMLGRRLGFETPKLPD
jgi:DNA polymerase-4